jgi:hypothetical protein
MNIAFSPFNAKQKGNNSKTFELHGCGVPNSEIEIQNHLVIAKLYYQ